MIRKRQEVELQIPTEADSLTISGIEEEVPQVITSKVTRRYEPPKLVVVTPTETRTTFDGRTEYNLVRGEPITVTPSFKKILERAGIILEIELPEE